MCIRDRPYLNLVGQFGNALTANDFLVQNRVDLMFLDIQMPGITGLEFLKNLKNPPMTIFTTAYPQHALEGFELDVIDYLVKPVRLQRFIKATNKAKEIFDLRGQSENVIENIEEEFIYIKADRKYIRLFFKDIKYIKGMKDYVMIYTDEQRLMTAMNLKTIFSQLPHHIFARVSKSHLININFIDAIDIDLIQLAGEEIPLGRTYKEAFITKYVKTNLIGRK